MARGNSQVNRDKVNAARAKARVSREDNKLRPNKVNKVLNQDRLEDAVAIGPEEISKDQAEHGRAGAEAAGTTWWTGLASMVAPLLEETSRNGLIECETLKKW